ncbi:MAG TPA: ImmA/IrrE family metallo-endopeptidase [Pyrinomonadaceae bacterium]|nr:ImmA/IrrE family metallo-endopeptidase [Pyrinomonadaceae bacterium]
MRNLLLPPTEKRQQFELCALGLRDFAGVADNEPLDPFALAHFAKLMVIDFEAIEGLSPETRAHLLGDGVEEWSGGACSRPLPNGWRLVILNPAHGKRRNRATLMEEVAHVFLGHTPNRLAVVTESDSLSPWERAGVRERSLAAKRKKEKTSSLVATSPHPNPLPKGEGTRQVAARDYNHDNEEAAYATGAAALVPYAALRRFVRSGRTAEQIARHFHVSRQLVEYRIKVTHLWAEYRSLQLTKPKRQFS